MALKTYIITSGVYDGYEWHCVLQGPEADMAELMKEFASKYGWDGLDPYNQGMYKAYVRRLLSDNYPPKADKDALFAFIWYLVERKGFTRVEVIEAHLGGQYLLDKYFQERRP